MARSAQRDGQPANLADLLERILDKGIVVVGDVKVNLLDIELLTIKIRLLVASVDRAKEMGIDWWEHDRALSSRADEDVIEENRRLRERISELEDKSRHAIDPAEVEGAVGPVDPADSAQPESRSAMSAGPPVGAGSGSAASGRPPVEMENGSAASGRPPAGAENGSAEPERVSVEPEPGSAERDGRAGFGRRSSPTPGDEDRRKKRKAEQTGKRTGEQAGKQKAQPKTEQERGEKSAERKNTRKKTEKNPERKNPGPKKPKSEKARKKKRKKKKKGEDRGE